MTTKTPATTAVECEVAAATKTPFADRFNLDRLLAAKQDELRRAQIALEQSAFDLTQTPSPVAEAAVAATEAEVLAAQKAIDRLEAAQAAAGRAVTAQALKERKALHAERVAQVRKLEAELDRLPQQAIELIDALGPILMRLGIALDEHRGVAWAALRESIGWERADRKYGHLFNTRRVAIDAAFASAAFRSGLHPFVQGSAPLKLTSAENLQIQLGEMRTRLSAALEAEAPRD